jgi:hypothetical protein
MGLIGLRSRSLADRADGLRPRVAHYFAYAALDEGQKAAIAPLQWTELLKGDQGDPASVEAQE